MEVKFGEHPSAALSRILKKDKRRLEGSVWSWHTNLGTTSWHL